jgi:hypothetical protein
LLIYNESNIISNIFLLSILNDNFYQFLLSFKEKKRWLDYGNAVYEMGKQYYYEDALYHDSQQYDCDPRVRKYVHDHFPVYIINRYGDWQILGGMQIHNITIYIFLPF